MTVIDDAPQATDREATPDEMAVYRSISAGYFNDLAELTMNQRLSVAGIKTERSAEGVYLSRNGIATRRPHVENCEMVCLAMFNVVI